MVNDQKMMVEEERQRLDKNQHKDQDISIIQSLHNNIQLDLSLLSLLNTMIIPTFSSYQALREWEKENEQQNQNEEIKNDQNLDQGDSPEHIKLRNMGNDLIERIKSNS